MKNIFKEGLLLIISISFLTACNQPEIHEIKEAQMRYIYISEDGVTHSVWEDEVGNEVDRTSTPYERTTGEKIEVVNINNIPLPPKNEKLTFKGQELINKLLNHEDAIFRDELMEFNGEYTLPYISFNLYGEDGHEAFDYIQIGYNSLNDEENTIDISVKIISSYKESYSILKQIHNFLIPDDTEEIINEIMTSTEYQSSRYQLDNRVFEIFFEPNLVINYYAATQ